MKLILSSFGITNKSIASAVSALANKEPKDIKIGFISTAANVEEGNRLNASTDI